MKKANKRIGIIGHFGGNENILDGQTIKTRILYSELHKATDWEILIVDTYKKRKNPLKLCMDTIQCLKTCQDIIVLLSKNGMKFYFPILSFCAKYFHKKIYHDVIGGNLHAYVKKYPSFEKYLNSFQVNWVETEKLKILLEDCGVTNCEVIPNFKRLKIVDLEHKNFEEPYYFCAFSRVMKEKGIEIAINAVQEINKKAGKTVCKLDIYGQIDDEYKNAFEKIITQATKAVCYKGMIPYNKSSETIKHYYALLFPTYWEGEGFPGTIIDAFSAGVPVIGSDWNCNREIIENGRNGILYPNDEVKDLKESIEWMITNKAKMNLMKENCIQTAVKYQPDVYIQKIVNEVEEN